MTGSALGFPAVWLRHNCPCPDCRDPVTGQRLIEITSIPNGCGLTVTAETTDSLEVEFTPQGHRAVFRRAWLTAHTLPAELDADARTEDAKRLWRAADLAGAALPAAGWPRYLADDTVRAACRPACSHGLFPARPARPA